MRPLQKRLFIGFASLAALPAILYAGLIVYWITPPLRSFSRIHEKLPAVFVEVGNTVYCRMWYCDFRFPLPDNALVVLTNIDSGGPDTINGSVFIMTTNGSPVNLRRYAEFLQQKKWEVNVASGFGCPEVMNNRPDEPFVSPGRVTHYPLFEGFGASLSEEARGGIQVETTNGVTQIHFSYFGDY